ncbi:D-beta-hydroxybutyrate dehydrogenase (fragment) [Cupriavidus taiwanensis]|uniref:D-beta-hydroxybutyrate dehydrogenase n=1 Tax=Cupriavidus taiwanensis TaxID=164546 RepID=A0A375JBV1_9BURK
MTSLNGKTALVTGSTSGIGLGIAQVLAQAGANIVLNGFGDSDAALAAIRAIGTEVINHAADMRNSKEIEAMFAVVHERFGALDVLVNNAGIQHVSPIETFDAQKWDDIIAINLSSGFHTTRLALPGMRTRNWGRIINIASVHGLVGSAGKSAYVAAKHGLVQHPVNRLNN